MAATADGMIAKHDSHLPTDWTSREDKKFFADTSKEAGVVLMGDKTFFTMKNPLPGRLNVVFTLEKNPPQREGVMWVSGEPEPVLKKLEIMGYKTAILGGGAFLNSLFLEKKLINEIILTIEPKIFGQGLSLFSKDIDCRLKLSEIKKLNDDTYCVKYQVIY